MKSCPFVLITVLNLLLCLSIILQVQDTFKIFVSSWVILILMHSCPVCTVSVVLVYYRSVCHQWWNYRQYNQQYQMLLSGYGCTISGTFPHFLLDESCFHPLLNCIIDYVVKEPQGYTCFYTFNAKKSIHLVAADTD